MIRTAFVHGALFTSMLVLAACGSGGSKSPSAAAPSATPLSAAQTVPNAAGTSQSAAATPATNPTNRVNGTVASIDGDTVTLKEGGSFTLSGQTRITRTVAATQSDLVVGKVVAVTAKQQQDNSLLASDIRIFPAAPSATFFQQYPMGGGNLMTNATIATVSGNSFTVTFPGGGGTVDVAPDTKISAIAAGTTDDIKPGASVTATVLNGVAQSVSIL
jgi:hypothetical protein